MTTDPNTPAGNTDKASTKHVVVDGRFAALLEEDFGIEWATVVEALIGEPQKQAIAICTWAGGKDDPKGALLAWSRKHRKVTHRPRRRGCGQHQERQRDGHGRRGDDRSGRSDTTTGRRSGVAYCVRSPSSSGAALEPSGGRLRQHLEASVYRSPFWERL